MIGGHGGNITALAQRIGCEPEEILDFSSNINPLGTIPELISYLKTSLHTIVSLPEVDNRTLIDQFSRHHGIASDCILAGSGTTQFIYALPAALQIKAPLIIAPTYADYADGCINSGITPAWHITRAENGFHLDTVALEKKLRAHDAVFLCNPNNPTGQLVDRGNFHDICTRHRGIHFVIDESYLPFAPSAKTHSFLHARLPNVIVLHSLSKIFGIPGLRTGFVVADPAIIKRLAANQLPWGVNILAQKAAGFLLTRKDASESYARKTIAYLASEREALTTRLSEIPGITCYPSTTSFVLIRLPGGVTAHNVCRLLEKEKLLIRNCNNFHGLDDRFIRIALKLPPANQQIAEAVKRVVLMLQENTHRMDRHGHAD